MTTIDPSIFPFLPNRVWRTYQGGAILDQMEGIPQPKDSHLPEDWIGSTTVAINPLERPPEEGLSRVRTEGNPLFKDLLESDPSGLLGDEHAKAFGPHARFLVKLLDSSIRLHFQAHPTAAFAQAHGLGLSGKAEAYHILQTRPEIAEPYIYIGFQRPPSREEFKHIIEQQDIEALKSCFDRIPVKPGDTFFIPGGRPHAIGPGILMTEIMEPSDLAVRFEFERAGYVLPESARFMNRGLDFCLDIFDFSPISATDPQAPYRCPPMPLPSEDSNHLYVSLLPPDRSPCFSIRKSVFSGKAIQTPERPHIGLVTSGSATIESGNQSIQLNTFDRYFVSGNASQLQITPHGDNCSILECYPPLPNTKS